PHPDACRPPPFPTRRSSDLRKAVEANTLHFRQAEPAEENIPVLVNSSSAATDERVNIERARLAQVLREQRLRIKTLQSAHRDAVDRKSTRLNSSHVKISYAV